MLEIHEIGKRSKNYPGAVLGRMGKAAPNTIYAIGDLRLLEKGIEKNLLAIFCSIRCPGNVIVKLYDVCRDLRASGVPVVSGFHSPMEKECLSILLRGKQPVLCCFARRLQTKRLPLDWRKAIEENRLLLLSVCNPRLTRSNQRSAKARNAFVAALASKILIAHAAHGGETENLCKSLLKTRRKIVTLDLVENENLLQIGAKRF
jgi:predicted Rossmann fold nucleotide-binding protein DprA/Smf involved in DNA uptake